MSIGKNKTAKLFGVLEKKKKIIIPVIISAAVLAPVFMLFTTFITMSYPAVDFSESMVIVISSSDETEIVQETVPVRMGTGEKFTEPVPEPETVFELGLPVDEDMTLAIETAISDDGSSETVFTEAGSDIAVLSIIHADGSFLIDPAYLGITGLEEYDYIKVEADGRLARRLVGDSDTEGNGTAQHINGDTAIHNASEELAEIVLEIIEELLGQAVRDDDIGWLALGAWDAVIEELGSFWLYSEGNNELANELNSTAQKVSILLSDWASRQRYLLTYDVWDDEEILENAVFLCSSKNVTVRKLLAVYDWLWENRNTEFREWHFETYIEQKLLALNIMANRGIVSRDFVRAMYHYFYDDHLANRELSIRIAETIRAELTQELLQEIADMLGIDMDITDLLRETPTVVEKYEYSTGLYDGMEAQG